MTRPGTQRGGCGGCLRVHRYTVSKQSGTEWPCQAGGCGGCVRVHRYTMSKQSGDDTTMPWCASSRVGTSTGMYDVVSSTCQTLARGCARRSATGDQVRDFLGGVHCSGRGRGLHWFTFQLDVSACCGIGVACRGCLGGVSGLLGGMTGS